ncbi:hypothetical protein AB0J80_05995 [Actinoplanes sp. NPDC049548]|uniref:hypothetical protein n=1 Tax=Actinoplanes sp. NPDC049548 TaxID=3155152 RepID=UPI0034491A1C
MRARIRTVAADLRRGRNADAYLAAGAALVVGTLGLAGVLSLRWTAPVLLLCIVPLLNLALATLDRVNEGSARGPVPVVEFPADPLRRDWARDTDLLIVGVTLIRTVRSHDSELASRLHSNKHVRVLVVDPDDVTAMTLTDRRRHYGAEDATGNAAEVRLTLSGLARIAAEVPTGKLEVRTIAFPIGLGGYFFSPGRPEARMYIETYPFKTPETQPHFMLTPSDLHWFEHFRLEMENMWNAGRPVTLGSGTP